MEQIEKEVDFYDYCGKCQYSDTDGTEDPCYECLGEPIRDYTRKPLNWKAAAGWENYLAPEH